jgi:hypothetical protein
VRGRADCAKKTPSGLKVQWRQQGLVVVSYRNYEPYWITTPRSRPAGPDKECTNMNTESLQSGEASAVIP